VQLSKRATDRLVKDGVQGYDPNGREELRGEMVVGWTGVLFRGECEGFAWSVGVRMWLDAVVVVGWLV